MPHDLLTVYIEREVTIYFIPAAGVSPSTEEGILLDCSTSGVLLEQDNDTIAFIPMSAVRHIRIKQKPTLWQRITGTY